MNKTGIACLAVAIAAISVPSCAAFNQQVHKGCGVTAKTVVYSSTDGNSSKTKRLDTTCGTFDVEDAWEAGSFSSWDLWSKLEVGHTYDLKTGGPRAGFFSVFPIVLEVTAA